MTSLLRMVGTADPPKALFEQGSVSHLPELIFLLLINNGKKVFPESERYKECLFGYSCIIHTDICTFTLVFSHGNKSRVGQGAP